MNYKVKTSLKDYQNATVEWMMSHQQKYGGGMILSEAGTGKSLCIVSYLQNLKHVKKVLIVCPAGLIKNWTNEFLIHTDIKATLNGELIYEYHGSKRSMNNNSKIVITSYNILEKDPTLYKYNYDAIILDEAHYIRNTKTKMSAAVMRLDSTYKWILTATPFFNHTDDFFVYFKFLLGIFDNLTEWKHEYNNKDYHSVKRLNELIKEHSVQYKKKDILKELPKSTEFEIDLEFSDIEREFYEALKTYSEERIKRIYETKTKMKVDTKKISKLLSNNSAVVLTLLLRLRQCCDSFQNIKMKRLENTNSLSEATEVLKFYNTQCVIDNECPICYEEVADHIANPCGHKYCKGCWDLIKTETCPMCRQYITSIDNINEKIITNVSDTNEDDEDSLIFQSSKIKKIQELVNDILKRNEKVIIVSQWITMLKLIKKTLNMDKHSVTLDGSVSIKNRHQYVSKFQNNSQCKICYISLMASAEGINLTAANNVILVDSWYNNSKMLQVSERVNRICQTKSVNIYKLKIKHSIEDKMIKLIKGKSSLSKIIINKWTDKNEEALKSIQIEALIDNAE
jgi:DNA repair protein RAD5